MAAKYEPKTQFGRFVNEFEETVIALILGAMTVITFLNVIVRYVFNSEWWRSFEAMIGIEAPRTLIWAFETTSFLFAWLVLFGMSYAVKVTAHLGVDAVTSLFSMNIRKILAIIVGIICIGYAFLVLKGAWDYWANFANLPQTTGRWFPTGFEEMKRSSYRGWYEVIDIPLPEWLRWIEPIMNEGEEYEKVPRFIPYAILPIGMALLLFRFVQATWRVITGEAKSLIVSHEAEDDVEAVKHMNAGD